ncbi:universal stress protein PHOS34-like [Chenopodium quinoa]|uniref:UspA domain-containing protein n=1 Tax=Chenopodium quinoa TaxID=63459 RepID=A0A803KRR4_CHEQI|nr:universal stress protein PHOS34-like [Chenopodium quinoa]
MAEGRRLGVALDFSKGCKAALKWAIDGLLRKGDTLIVIHVKHSQSLESRNLIWSDTGSPLIPLAEFCDPEVMHSYGVEREPEIFELLDVISKQLQVTVLWKIYWGDAREKICEAVGSMELNTLIMGSRGLGSIQRVLLGSVTNYVLEHASCPVTVVKDSRP